MIENIGRLTPADENLNHQIVDTFATVAESDYGWTEKTWGALMRKDGAMTVSFGLGKYHNRNVIDGFGGVSRGSQQWTVRASRQLDTDLLQTGVGPVQYEVVEPLKKIRFRLDRNDTQPIAYDILFEGAISPFFEKRNRLRAGNRVGMDVVRYHQAGSISGWVEVNGERHAVDDDWFAFRDHSWGMRGHGVGMHPSDLQPGRSETKNLELLWGPSLLTRPDGSKYELMHFLFKNDNWQYFSGHMNEVAGNSGDIRQIAMREMIPDLRFDPKTREFLGGTYRILLENGERRTLEVTPVGDSGFYLRTGLYGEWNGQRHGSWKGAYHEEGEFIADIKARLQEIGQFRDKPIMVRDGDAVGYGLQESVYSGLFPEMGLGAESDFPSDL